MKKFPLNLLFPGFLIGAVSAFSPGFIFVFFLVLLTSFLFFRLSTIHERRFVCALFLTGFLARTILSLGLDLGSWIVEGKGPMKRGAVQEWNLGIVDRTREYVKMGDSDYYSQRGYAIAQYARGVREPVVLFRIQQYGGHGYAYVIGAFYYLFGFSPVSVKILNCFIGALLGPFLFLLLKECFNPSVAKWASVGTTFFPSLILWSAGNLKEPSLFLLTVLALLLFVKGQRARSVISLAGYGVMFVCAVVLHMSLRSTYFSLSLAGCLLFSQAVLLLKKKKALLFLFLGLLLAFCCLHVRQLRSGLEFGFYRHIGYAGDPGVSYRYLPNEFYLPGYTESWMSSGKLGASLLLNSMVRSTFHFLMEPVPVRIDNLFILLVYPQMVVWYFLLPFAVLGMGWSLRWNRDRTLFLTLTLVSWTLMGALTSGNVGTVFRIRDMVTPFFLAFACAGFWGLVRGPGETLA